MHAADFSDGEGVADTTSSRHEGATRARASVTAAAAEVGKRHAWPGRTAAGAGGSENGKRWSGNLQRFRCVALHTRPSCCRPPPERAGEGEPNAVFSRFAAPAGSSATQEPRPKHCCKRTIQPCARCKSTCRRIFNHPVNGWRLTYRGIVQPRHSGPGTVTGPRLSRSRSRARRRGDQCTATIARAAHRWVRDGAPGISPGAFVDEWEGCK